MILRMKKMHPVCQYDHDGTTGRGAMVTHRGHAVDQRRRGHWRTLRYISQCSRMSVDMLNLNYGCVLDDSLEGENSHLPSPLPCPVDIRPSLLLLVLRRHCSPFLGVLRMINNFLMHIKAHIASSCAHPPQWEYLNETKRAKPGDVIRKVVIP
jgi:hypothetical protein